MASPATSWKIPSPAPATRGTPPRTGGPSANVRLVCARLVNRYDQFLTASNGKYFMEKQPLTPALIEQAVNGEISLGLCAVSGIGTSRWTVWDADDDALWPKLVELARHLAPQGHVLLERSRRGGHLWAFHSVTAWHNAHHYGEQLAKEFGLDGIEVYPKFNGTHSVRLPGSLHPKTGMRYPLIDPATGEFVELVEALRHIQPIELPEVEDPVIKQDLIPGQSAERFDRGDFTDLVEALSRLTRVHVYGPEKAKARCPFHRDQHPSLMVKGSRFHCLSHRCKAWGDATDVRRFIEKGIDPPRGN
jgi:hypothetical protein